MAFLDEYTIWARQAPAFLAGAPAVIATYALFPDLRSSWGALGGLVAALGGPAALAYLTRSLGKRLEPELFKAWGGKPTTAMLRWCDDRISVDTKRRYHDRLRAVGIDMPSAEDEARDPAAADAKYESAGEWLLRKARDKKAYPFVFTQNINYGFARNLLGLKPLGLGVATICAVAQMVLAGWALHKGSELSAFVTISSAIGVAAVAFWGMAVRSGWVLSTAVAYSRALLEICDDAVPPRAKPAKKPKAKGDIPSPG